MPSIIDPQTIHVDDLPAIWSPVQWELTEEERVEAVNEQATASLLWTMDTPEAILRLLLGETEIQRLYQSPDDYDPEEQGEWDEEIYDVWPLSFYETDRSRAETGIPAVGLQLWRSGLLGIHDRAGKSHHRADLAFGKYIEHQIQG